MARKTLSISMAVHVTDPRPSLLYECTKSHLLSLVSSHFTLQFLQAFPSSLWTWLSQHLIDCCCFYLAMAISRVLLLFALCVLPGLVSARTLGNPFHIQGRVYCDTCRCGFETTATTYIPGTPCNPISYVDSHIAFSDHIAKHIM